MYQILVILGKHNPEEISYLKIINLSTSPVKCSHRASKNSRVLLYVIEVTVLWKRLTLKYMSDCMVQWEILFEFHSTRFVTVL